MSQRSVRSTKNCGRKSRNTFMKVSALQEFLRNVANSWAAIGTQPKSLEDLQAVVRTVEPFKDLDLDQFANFLVRAANFRETGKVPVVTVPGLDDATNTARKLAETVQTLRK